MNSLLNIAVIIAAIWLPAIVQADIVTFRVDITNNDQFGSNLPMRVFGFLTVDADIADTAAAVVSSSMQYQFNDENPAVDLSLFFNAGGTDLDFVVIGNELYVQGSGANNQLIQWASPGANFVAFDIGSGPLADHAALVDNRTVNPRAWLDGDTTQGNGYLLGTAIPEPSSIWLLVGVSGVLISTRRRNQYLPARRDAMVG